MQAQTPIEPARTQAPGTFPRRRRRPEPGTALRWGVVLALAGMLLTLGWAVRHGERAAPEPRPPAVVSALTTPG
jgi:hypothetical protein